MKACQADFLLTTGVQHGSVGSNLVNELPSSMIKKMLKFYELNERRIKLIEDETAARMVRFLQ